MIRLVSHLILVLILWVSPACADAHLMPGTIVAKPVGNNSTRFTLITSDGHVSYSVPDDWKMLSFEGQPPNFRMVFQIDNPADRSSSDFTNIAIQLFPKSAVFLNPRLQAFEKKNRETETRRTEFEGWTTIEQEAYQNATLYTVIDTKREIADVIVVVRLSWPHLKNNPPNYGATIQGAFRAILHSFDGALGKY